MPRASEQLTDRQARVYRFILETIEARGRGPTPREIGAAFAVDDLKGVLRCLSALERRGLIRRGGDDGRGRGGDKGREDLH